MQMTKMEKPGALFIFDTWTVTKEVQTEESDKSIAQNLPDRDFSL